MKTLFTILLLPLTLFGQVFPSGGGGGTGAASNWSASGTTNSTLAGTAYLNSLVATNSIQTLSTNGGYLEMASITAPISVPPSGSLSLFPTNGGFGYMNSAGTVTMFAAGGGASLVQPVTDFRFKLGSQLASIDAAWSTNHVLFFDDFLSVNPTPSALGWSFELSGGSVNPLTTYTTNHFGQFYISSGTATGNYADVRLSFSSIPISPGVSYFYELSARCFALAGSGNTNHVRIGFGNQTGATEFTSGIWIDLNATNSVNWRLGTVAGGAITYSDSGVAADTSWHSLGFLVGAGGSQVALYIDGVSKCTNTTAIPTGISNLMGPVQENNWVSGSGASLVIDAARFGWCQH